MVVNLRIWFIYCVFYFNVEYIKCCGFFIYYILKKFVIIVFKRLFLKIYWFVKVIFYYNEKFYIF